MTDCWYPLSVPTIGEEEIAAATEVLRSGNTTMGEKVEEFEEAFARHVGVRHAVMVNSGSSADLIMAFASHVTGEVIVPAVTWPTHVWSWIMAGCRVRLVDVDGLNTTAALVTSQICPSTGGISLVHLMGLPVDRAGFDYLPVPITEDCCEALGAEVGHLGQMASWSFFFSHQMTTMEGGAVTTDSPAVASRLRQLRSHGWARHEGKDPYTFYGPGFNVRPTEIAAAVGLVQLGRLDGFNKIRAENRDRFAAALHGCPHIAVPEPPEGARPSWFGLPLFLDRPASRDALAGFLGDHGVETRPILGGNLARQPAFLKHPQIAHGPLPGADRVHDHGLYVGLHPVPDNGTIAVAQLIRQYLEP